MTAMDTTLAAEYERPRRHSALLLLLGIAVTMLIAAMALLAYGRGLEGWRHAEHFTARFSFCVFLLVFIIRPLSNTFHGAFARTLLRERRGLGLAFAGAHGAHLSLFPFFLAAGGTSPPAFVLGFGSIGYLVIAFMAATSNDASVAWLGPRNWRRLHSFGLYYLWSIFAFSYLAHAAGLAAPAEAAYDVALFAAVAAFVFRVVA